MTASEHTDAYLYHHKFDLNLKVLYPVHAAQPSLCHPDQVWLSSTPLGPVIQQTIGFHLVFDAQTQFCRTPEITRNTLEFHFMTKG